MAELSDICGILYILDGFCSNKSPTTRKCQENYKNFTGSDVIDDVIIGVKFGVEFHFYPQSIACSTSKCLFGLVDYEKIMFWKIR